MTSRPETRQTLTVTDNRTGDTYEIPIVDGSIRGSDLGQIRTADSPGLMVFDPALRNTATCRSSITYQEAHQGILRHAGYSIEDLAEHSTYLEVAYLIFHRELPDREQYARWCADIADNYLVHRNLTRFLDGFRHDAHPMGILISTVAALSTFYPEAKNLSVASERRRHAIRLIAQVPTLAAFAHRRMVGLRYAYPDVDLSYVGNFLNMMFKATELRYQPDPDVERALDVLFILHADHGQACSATTMRCVGSAKTDPYSAAAAAAAALYGRFHDEGFHAVNDMFREIGTTDRIPAFLERVKRERSEPPGFGHRLYRTYDPRARILRREAEKLVTRNNRRQLFDIAVALDEAASKDDYFLENNLFPIVDYYETVMYEAMGFRTELFPVLFAIPRFVGWLAQWEEMITDPDQITYRPRQIYSGASPREYTPIDQRD